MAEDLKKDEVHVWHSSLTVSAAELTYAETFLSGGERRYAHRFTNEHAKIEFVIGRARLRELLGRYVGRDGRELEFGITREGKPFLVTAPEYEFNLTHSGDVVLYGIARARPVGVDIERLKPIPRALELSKRYMLPEEHALVTAASSETRDRAFLSLWVKREGSGKAYGVGIWKVLESHRRDTPNPLFAEIMRDYSYQVIDYPPGYVACVAALGADWRLVRRGNCTSDC
jgi:4'-phosphopantetheinyl transferase